MDQSHLDIMNMDKGVDHSGMNHHGGMDMGGNQCSMNMLFTWSSNNLCIIFRQWRITGPLSLVLSLAAIALLTAGYELVREISRRYEQSHDARMNSFTHVASRKDNEISAERNGKIIKATLYAIQVFYSFFIMLLFMTYNGWVMIAVAVGAFIGYIVFSPNMSPTKSIACH